MEFLSEKHLEENCPSPTWV